MRNSNEHKQQYRRTHSPVTRLCANHTRSGSTNNPISFRALLLAGLVFIFSCPPAIADLAAVNGSLFYTTSSITQPLPSTFYYYLLAILIGAASTLDFQGIKKR